MHDDFGRSAKRMTTRQWITFTILFIGINWLSAVLAAAQPKAAVTIRYANFPPIIALLAEF